MAKQFHIALDESMEARYAILPGDPGRVEEIAAYLDDAHFVAQNREFVTWCGKLEGQPVLVTSTGIGGPSAAIAMEELSRVGVRSFVRCGTCGAMQEEIAGGDLIVATAAVRMEGTSREYTPLEVPAVADFSVTGALAYAVSDMGLPFHAGVVQSKDSFYGQHEPERMPVGTVLLQNWKAYQRCGVLASEMECAALFTVAMCLRVRCGAVLCALWNQEREKASLTNDQVQTEHASKAAVLAVKRLIREDCGV